jgi:hypothetical protein
MVLGDGMLDGFRKSVGGSPTDTGGKITFRRCKVGIVGQTTPVPKPPDSPKQQEWQEEWREHDRMFRAMTPGQFATWKRYYWGMRKNPETRHQTLKTGRCAVVDGASKYIGYYAYWMRKTSRYDLRTYLAEGLGADLEILGAVGTAGGLWVKVKITKARDGYYEWEPEGKAVFRVR